MLHFLIRFVSLHQPTHRCVVHAEMRRNGRHRMLPRQIRQRDRFVTRVRAGKFGQCPLCRSALRTGDFRERRLFVDQGLHFLDERWRAEVDLALQLIPHTGRSRALVNEGDVTFNRASALCSKLRQHEVSAASPVWRLVCTLPDNCSTVIAPDAEPAWRATGSALRNGQAPADSCLCEPERL